MESQHSRLIELLIPGGGIANSDEGLAGCCDIDSDDSEDTSFIVPPGANSSAEESEGIESGSEDPLSEASSDIDEQQQHDFVDRGGYRLRLRRVSMASNPILKLETPSEFARVVELNLAYSKFRNPMNYSDDEAES